VFNGDTLLSTVDQAFKNGTATGTAQTRYVHPDHLGSTNVVANENGALVQTLDFYPYGATRVSVSTSTNEKRKFIGQFLDDSNLEYLNARYYNPAQGQFISQDPVFWELGLTNDGKAALTNPQSQNSYGYASDNPITNKDPSGRFWWVGFYDWSGYEGWKGVGMKALEVAGGHSRAMAAMQQNQSTVNAISAKYGVSPPLANAIMYEEQSHLLPGEGAKDYLFPNSQLGGYDGGVGVMQVTGGVGKQYGYDKTELARDPRKNIDAGIGNLAKVQTGNVAFTASKCNYGSTQSLTNYGQRVAAQVNNPNYNTNVLVYGLQQIVSSLQKIVDSIKK
jgi:RHS repeat-associated protein